MAALRADVQIALDFGAVQHRIAGRTFGPEPFGDRARAALGLDARGDDSFEPGHGASLAKPLRRHRNAKGFGIFNAPQVQAACRGGRAGETPVAARKNATPRRRQDPPRPAPRARCPRCFAPCGAGRRWRMISSHTHSPLRSTAMRSMRRMGVFDWHSMPTKSGKIVLPEQCLRRSMHRPLVEGAVYPGTARAQQRRACARVQDAVAVGAPPRAVARMKSTGNLARPLQGDRRAADGCWRRAPRRAACAPRSVSK